MHRRHFAVHELRERPFDLADLADDELRHVDQNALPGDLGQRRGRAMEADVEHLGQCVGVELVEDHGTSPRSTSLIASVSCSGLAGFGTTRSAPAASTASSVLRWTSARDDDDARLAIQLAQGAQHVDAADVLHREIEQHDLRPYERERLDRGRAARRFDHFVAGSLEDSAMHASRVRRIVDDHDLGHAQIISRMLDAMSPNVATAIAHARLDHRARHSIHDA